MDPGKKYERITAPARNWRLSVKMKLCSSYQVLCWQSVFIFETANFLQLQNVICNRWTTVLTLNI